MFMNREKTTTIIKTEINKKVSKMLKQNKYYLTSIDDLPYLWLIKYHQY